MKYYYPLLIGFFWLTACSEKEEKDLFFDSYPTELYLTQDIKYKPRLFTKTHEVTDTAIISRFVRKYAWTSMYHKDTTYNYNSSVYLDTIRIESPTRAIFDRFGFKEAYTIKRTGNEFTFVPVDTARWYTPSPYNTSFHILKKLCVYPPLYEKAIDNKGGWGDEYEAIIPYYATGSKNKLVRSGFKFVIFYNYEHTMTAGGANNLFKENSYTFLDDDDTLAIQQGYQIYER